MGESAIIGPEMTLQITEQIKTIRQRLLTAQSTYKSYADHRRSPLSFEGDHVFLKVSPRHGVSRFGKKGKLTP